MDFTCNLEFTKIAEAYKCYGARVEHPYEIRPALDVALKANQSGVPAVLDFIVDPWDYPQGFVDFHKKIWGIPEAMA